MRTRRARCAVTVVLAGALLCVSACGLERPAAKDDTRPDKVAVTRGEAEQVVERFHRVRRSAYSSLAAGPLAAVESKPVLLIDAGAIKARRLLRDDAPPSSLASENVDVTAVHTPRFDAYPLWFVAVVRDRDRDVTRLLVFARQHASTPWSLVASPETLTTEGIPSLEVDAEGALETLPAGKESGLSASPETVTETYAKALDDRTADANDAVAQDSFIEEMRRVADASSSIKGVQFGATWKPHKVRHAARTADGGALVFATLTRDDEYRVRQGVSVNWPDGSVQKAFLSGKLLARGKLRYYHQVLLYVPPEGAGKPRAIGQYGGIIDADGY